MNEYFVERDKCPACHGKESVMLYDASYTEQPISGYLNTVYTAMGKGVEFEYLNGARYIIDECKNCGLIYQREVPGDVLMRKLYGEWLDAEVIKKNIMEQRGADFYMEVANSIARSIKYLKKPPGQIKFLDFGMGAGNWCLMAKSFGCDTYGTDLSNEHMEYANEIGIKTLDWNDLGEHKFDFINAEQVFEHLGEPLEILNHLVGSLSSNGIIRLNVPRGWDIKRRLEIMDWEASLTQEHPNSLNNIAPLQHINCFIRNSLIQMGKIANLLVVDVPQLPSTTGNKGLCEKLKSIIPLYRFYAKRKSEKHKANLMKIDTCVFYTKN